MIKKLEKLAIGISYKAMNLHHRICAKLFGYCRTKKLGKNGIVKSESTMAIGITALAIAAVVYPEISYGEISSVNDLSALAKDVKKEAQGSVLTILLNAAGIACAGFALITQRWTMLLLGIAYLVFVYAFFGFVNGKYNVQ